MLVRTDEVTEQDYQDSWNYLVSDSLVSIARAGLLDDMALAAIEEHRRGETEPLETLLGGEG